MTSKLSISSCGRSPEPTGNRRRPGGGRWRWRRWAGFLAVLVGGLAAWSAVAGEAPALSSDQLKAAFILNFPKYVDWPTNVFATPTAPIVLGIVGDEKLGDEIERLGNQKIISGHSLVVRRLAADDKMEGCHILFVAAAQNRHAPEILARLKGWSVLTVGEADDFLEQGGMINLARKERKIGLEVNLTPVSGAKLKISSKLLGVATVKGRPN